MRNRRRHKLSIWLIPFYALALVAGAIALLVYAIAMGIKLVLEARHKSSPLPGISRKENAEVEREWKRYERGDWKVRGKIPYHTVGGRKVLGGVMADMGDVPDTRPPPPRRVVVLEDGSTF